MLRARPVPSKSNLMASPDRRRIQSRCSRVSSRNVAAPVNSQLSQRLPIPYALHTDQKSTLDRVTLTYALSTNRLQRAFQAIVQPDGIPCHGSKTLAPVLYRVSQHTAQFVFRSISTQVIVNDIDRSFPCISWLFARTNTGLLTGAP